MVAHWATSLLAGNKWFCIVAIGILAMAPIGRAYMLPSHLPRSTAAASRTAMSLGPSGNGDTTRRDAVSIAAAGLGLFLSQPAVADTCSRKDCQPKANYVDAEETERKKDQVEMKGIRGDSKTRTKYPDYTETASGVQYKDVKAGAGEMPKDGERVVIDWEGYTIGYYGRIFQKKNSVQGGAFAEDPGFYRFVLGTNSLVPGLEEGIKGMKPGGVRQIVVPPGPLSYPEDDSPHKRVGPRPSTFDGMRALNFVLENKQGLIDKTLLFNVKLIRIDKSDGQGGFVRSIQ